MSFFILALLASAFVLLPLLRSSTAMEKANRVSRAAQNRQVLAERRLELQSELKQGLITEPEFRAAEDEILVQVLESVAERDTAERSVRWSRWILCLAAFLLIGGGLLLYQQLGYYADLQTQRALQEFAREGELNAEQQRQQLEALLPLLQERVEKRSDKLAWRHLLAQLQTELQQYDAAARSYLALLDEESTHAGLWASYAQALFLANGRVLNEPAEEALNKALALNPSQSTALGLQGMAAFEAGRTEQAVVAWRKLLATLPADSPQRQIILGALQHVQGEAESGSEEEEVQGQQEIEPGGVLVSVSAAPELPLSPHSVVFVYARAANGPPMPLAVQRLRLADLPAVVKLDDSMAMMPAMRLSQFASIELIARASVNGSASPEKGDWEARSGVLQREQLDTAVELNIDQPWAP